MRFDHQSKLLISSVFTSFKAEDEDIDKNAKMAYTIREGNDKELFWINSTSGELFLVAPLTVTASDSIVLLVEVLNTFATNTSFQDTALVKITFYGRQNYSVILLCLTVFSRGYKCRFWKIVVEALEEFPTRKLRKLSRRIRAVNSWTRNVTINWPWLPKHI